MLSIETYVLTQKYTDNKVNSGVDKAIAEAVRISEEYTDRMVAVASWKIEIVDTLPVTDIDTHTIYFVPIDGGDEENDSYYEYIYLNNKWELVGNTELDLSNYMTRAEIAEYVAEHAYVLIPATNSTLGGVIIDTETIDLDSTGKISIIPINSEDIANLFTN